MTTPPGHMPSLNALRAFEVASRHLNFRRAGQELGVTQGAVAQQIRALEAELGMKLFERHPRTLALTANGQRYVVGVRRAFDLLAEATRSLRPEPGHLTVSVTPTFATKWLLPRLGAYTQAHPATELRVLATERISHFQTEAIDLAVRYGRPPFGPGLQADLLFEECLVAVASPQVQARLVGASGTTLLHDGQSSWELYFEQCDRDALAKAMALATGCEGGTAPQAIRFNQTTLAIDAALMGQGVALVQEHFAAQDLDAGRLVQTLPEKLHTDAGYYLVHPRKQRHPEAVAQARRWFLQQAAQ